MTDFLLGRCWPLLAGVAVKSLCVLALAAVAALTLRRSSAAARHLVWRLALAGLLLLPAFSLLPAVWQVPLAPRALLVTPDAPVVTPDTSPNPPVSGGPREAGRWVPSPPELGAGGRSGAGGPAPSARPLPWPVWACAAWLAGAVLTLLPSLVGLAGVGRLARRSPPVPESSLRELLTTLAKDLGVTTPVHLLIGEAGTPMTWGWLRPIILLPTGADAWPEDRLRAVLLHELAHIARADWPAQMTAHLACALYWYNPAVWLAARQARIESERACDDRVLLAGIPAPDYARHLLDVARALNTQTLPAALPMVNAPTLKARLPVILDRVRRRGEVSKRMNTVLTQAVLLPAILLYTVTFAVSPPPDRSVRLDAHSYQVIGQANAATASLRSLRAHIHAVTSFTYRREVDTMDGTVIFQRPNLARVEVPGISGSTFISDGRQGRLAEHDGSYTSTQSVAWNGDDMTSDDESLPFVQYFFQPDFHRLGAYLVEDAGLPFQKSEIPVTGHSLGVATWQGAQYEVVEFTRNAEPLFFQFKNVTTVYVGTDHLVHRIVGKAYFSNGVRTDDISLTDLQPNRASPRSYFRLPSPASKPPREISILPGGSHASA